MIQDLHSHTRRSFCGMDSAKALVLRAISEGIDTLGITDHNYGVGYRDPALFRSGDLASREYSQNLKAYFQRLTELKTKYASSLRLLRGIEIATLQNQDNLLLPKDVDVSYFDYCLVEHLDHPDSETKGDLFSFAKRLGAPLVGVAHTDLFSHVARLGEDALSYFRRMADRGIFWEMNVSFDSIHGYREHPYMLRFFQDEEQQAIIRKSGCLVSVGFDGHRLYDYLPQRVKEYNRLLEKLRIPRPFSEKAD